MPLLRNGQWADKNPWIRLEDNESLPTDMTGNTPVVCSLNRFIELEGTKHPVSGIWLSSNDDVLKLAGYLDHVQLIVVDFPVFTDGRGYSQARILRSELGFSGELRASGDVRADQILFMARAGIDTFDFPEQQDDEMIKDILSRFTVNYQPSYSLPIAG